MKILELFLRVLNLVISEEHQVSNPNLHHEIDLVILLVLFFRTTGIITFDQVENFTGP